MKGTRTILGVAVGRTHYDGILLEASDDAFVVVERFSAPRWEDELVSPEFSGETGNIEALPGVTVQLDSSPGSQESADFAGKSDILDDAAPARRGASEGMDRVLQVWLSRARQLGYDRVEMAACASEPDLLFLPIRLDTGILGEDDPGPSSERSLSWGIRRSLLKHVRSEVPGKVDPQRVGFVRLAPDAPDGEYLGLVDTAQNPLHATLTQMATQRWRRHLRPVRIDADIALIAAVVRRNATSDQLTHTAYVHVGVDDTHIVFFRRDRIVSQERVPTLTVYTEPATVASRILLMQDSLRIPALESLYVTDDTPERTFVQALRDEFDQTEVKEFSELLSDLQFEKRTPRGVMSAGQWFAAAAAWELGQDDVGVLSRPDESLLPSAVRRRFASVAATAWHTWLALVILLAVVVVQGYRYVSIRDDISRMEESFAREIGMELQGGLSIEQMRAALTQRLDSLRSAQLFAQQSVRFMDSLATGAERWTHFITHLGAASQAEQGMWFTVMQPVRQTPLRHVRLEGFAFQQEQVASLARELDATIEFMAVTREGGRRLFTFLLTAPVPWEASPAKRYHQQWVREQVRLAADSTSATGDAS